MTDRELLELAAKAAGIPLYVWGTPGSEGFARMDMAPPVRWNPLTDDGDALRLAVKLKLENIGGEVWVCSITSISEYEHEPYAATRRAIVHAAAEIGKDMK